MTTFEDIVSFLLKTKLSHAELDILAQMIAEHKRLLRLQNNPIVPFLSTPKFSIGDVVECIHPPVRGRVFEIDLGEGGIELRIRTTTDHFVLVSESNCRKYGPDIF